MRGAGTALIRRSKTDQAGEVCVHRLILTHILWRSTPAALKRIAQYIARLSLDYGIHAHILIGRNASLWLFAGVRNVRACWQAHAYLVDR